LKRNFTYGALMSKLPPIVFVHGIKGSSLRGPNGDLLWIRVRDLFTNRDRNLALPLEWENGKQLQDGVWSDGALRGILGKPIYRKFLDGMKRLGWDVFCYSYDWRRNQSELSKEFITFLKQIREKHSKPLIISHSNGGIIVDLALRTKDAGDIVGVLHAGVPFGDGVSFLPDMTNGESILWNPVLVGSSVHLSWAAPWAYFPISDKSRLLDEKYNQITHDWNDVFSWKRLKLGPFSSNFEISKKQIEHMRHAMKAAAIVRTKIEADWPKNIHRPPTAVLRSRSHKTPQAYKHDSKGLWELELPIYGEGDGRVLFDSAIPPFKIEAEYETKLIHGALLNDVDIVDVALRELLTLPQIPASL
jgi:hypothetical protein